MKTLFHNAAVTAALGAMLLLGGCQKEPIAVTGVSVSPTTLSLTVGQSETITATVMPADAANKAVTWSSDNDAVASVSNGKVTAKSAGTAKITVKTADGGKSATCSVTVAEPIVAVASVSLDKANLEMTEGDEASLVASVTPENATNKNVTWSTDNPSVATVDNGKVKAVGAGNAVITVKTDDGGKTASCAVSVAAKVIPVTSVSINPSSLDMLVGDEATLSVTVSPDNATDKTVVWSSDDPLVATVDNGKVTAVAPGSTDIIASVGDVKAVCTVTVTAPTPPSKIKIVNLPDISEGKIAPALIVDGDKYIVLGGHTDWFDLAGTAEMYKDGQWTVIAGGIFHDLAAQVTLSDGKTLIAGGCSSSFGVGQSAVTHIYDPATGTISVGPSMLTHRAWARGALLSGGDVLIAGNWYENSLHADVFSHADGTFHLSGGDMSNQPCSPFIFPTPDGGALLVAGWDNYGARLDGNAQVYKFNPASGGSISAKEIFPLSGYVPISQYGASSSMMEDMRTADGKYIFIMATTTGSGNCLASFNPADESFEKLIDLPKEYDGLEYYYASDLLVDRDRNLLYLFSMTTKDGTAVGLVRIFDLDTMDEVATASLGRDVTAAGKRLLPDGGVLIVGGTEDGSNYYPLRKADILYYYDIPQ